MMANWLSQENRFLQLTTPLGPKELAPIYLTGIERISGLFHFELKMISGNTAIKPAQLIGKPITVKMGDSIQSAPRYFHGLVENFQAGAIAHGIRHYSVALLPWLSFLNYTSDCRVFQNKSTPDIAKMLFQELGMHDFDVSGLTKTYTKRDYCVQYRETTLHFVNRLFAEEGIFYFFHHQADKHVLILADKSSAFKQCASNVVFDKGSQKGQCLTSWQAGHSFYSGKYEQNDYDYENPSTSLHTTQQSSAKLSIAQKFGLYDYPGRYETVAQGKQSSQQAFAAQELNYDLRNGSGNYSSFSAGSKFTLTDLPVLTDEGDYILTWVNHMAVDDSYLGNSGGTQGYANNFSCLPGKVEFQPPRPITKPLIYSSQTATVVGPAGEEIYIDKHGRVKVQFHWDRLGKKNDTSSCWVRVAQNVAGKNWGMVFMPRMGQEVIVQFLEGDPDRPVITGSVYNANNPAPYKFPFEQTRSGIKSHSTKGGGDEANELRFEDKHGQEEIYLHAQKDFTRVIKNNDSTVIVQGDQTTTIQAGKSVLEASKSIELRVGSNTIMIDTAGIHINGEVVKINN